MTLPAKSGGSLPEGKTTRPNLRASFVAISAIGAALALGALVLFGRKASLSAAVGVAVAEINLWALARIVSAMLREERAGAWASVAFLKMLALIVVVGLLMRYAAVAPLAMLVGFGALPMGIAIGSLLSD